MADYHITLAGHDYPMRFTLGAARRMTERFGDLSKMGEALSDGGTSEQLDALNFVLKVSINAGMAYNRMMGLEVPPALQCEPEDLLDLQSASDAMMEIQRMMSGDMNREVETVSKNGGATQG